MERYDFIFVGATEDGLLGAALLAEAGRRVLVLDDFRPKPHEPADRKIVWPPTDQIVRLPSAVVKRLDMGNLAASLVPPTAAILLKAGEAPLVRARNQGRSASLIGRVSPRDAEAYLDYGIEMARVRRLLHAHLEGLPRSPDDGREGAASASADLRPEALSIDSPTLDEIWRFSTLSLTRFLERTFENETVRCLMACSALFHAPGAPADPRLACSAQTLLNDPFLATASDRFGMGRATGAAGFAGEGDGGLIPALIETVTRFGGTVRLDARIIDWTLGKGGAGECHVDGEEEPLGCGHLMVADLSRQPRLAAKSEGEAGNLSVKWATAQPVARPEPAWALTFDGRFEAGAIPRDLKPFSGWVYLTDGMSGFHPVTAQKTGIKGPLSARIVEVQDRQTGAWHTQMMLRPFHQGGWAGREDGDTDYPVNAALSALEELWPEARLDLKECKSLLPNEKADLPDRKDAAHAKPLTPFASFDTRKETPLTAQASAVLRARGLELFTGMSGALSVLRHRGSGGQR